MSDQELTRRRFLAGATAGAALLVSGLRPTMAMGKKNESGPYTLPELPYKDDALSPYISSKTLEFHYGKHHAGYVKKYNDLVRGTPMADWSLEKNIQEAAKHDDKTGVFNNGAQIWNHNFYWKSMSPKGGGKPKGPLHEAIEKDFGGYEKFHAEFVEKASSLFGTGWTWLVEDAGKLRIVQTFDADLPIVHNQTPLITIDVWEHAYYLDYQNKRKDYVLAFLDHLVNWEFAAENLKEKRSS